MSQTRAKEQEKFQGGPKIEALEPQTRRKKKGEQQTQQLSAEEIQLQSTQKFGSFVLNAYDWLGNALDRRANLGPLRSIDLNTVVFQRFMRDKAQLRYLLHGSGPLKPSAYNDIMSYLNRIEVVYYPEYRRVTQESDVSINGYISFARKFGEACRIGATAGAVAMTSGAGSAIVAGAITRGTLDGGAKAVERGQVDGEVLKETAWGAVTGAAGGVGAGKGPLDPTQLMSKEMWQTTVEEGSKAMAQSGVQQSVELVKEVVE